MVAVLISTITITLQLMSSHNNKIQTNYQMEIATTTEKENNRISKSKDVRTINPLLEYSENMY